MLIQSAGMKQTLQYDQTSCRLQVEGLPDVSRGLVGGAIGIITGWRLQWLGRPDVEGQREHLQALLEVVLPYARYRISAIPRSFGEPESPVQLHPAEGDKHRLVLRSSQAEKPELEQLIDDAELADLVQVLDRLRRDPRLQIQAQIPPVEPLGVRELIDRIPLRRRLAAPLGGLTALVLAAGLGSLWPTPRPLNLSPEAPAGQSRKAASPASPGASSAASNPGAASTPSPKNPESR
ncbi:MAG: DUF4335 domain-containing protein [Synechococcaceae cyanobacterium]|nr:DUF4335 domain-containing protein [Synechococcaceae cyanobacterium]